MKRLYLTLAFCLALGGVVGMFAGQTLVLGQADRKAQIPKDLSSYRNVVKQALPAVVSIKATAKPMVSKAQFAMPKDSRFGDMPGLPEEFGKWFKDLPRQPFSKDLFPRSSFGSGVIVDAKGIILTNDHVVRNAERVEVTLHDGRKFLSQEIKRDPRTDLAIVRIDAQSPLPYLALGDSDAMEVGDRVLAMGAPLGMTGTVTSGIVSAKSRSIGMNMYEDYLQTDAAINPGNSGGPLVNLAGEIVGINTAIKSNTGGFQGIGFAVSSKLAKNIMEHLLRDGVVQRGYLGVQVRQLEPQVAKRLGVGQKKGIVISKVTDGSPAAKAGLRDGDILTALAGNPVKNVRDLQWEIARLPIGKAVELTVFRDGRAVKMPVTIEKQPERFGLAGRLGSGSTENQPAPSTIDKIGIKVTELTPQNAEKYGFANRTEGVVVAEVNPNSAASMAGLTRGMLIVKIDGNPVKTADDVRKAFREDSPEKGTLFQVRTPLGGVNYLLVPRATT